jgi:antitoxin HicB
MQQRFEYPAKVEQDSAGFYLVTFSDFPEAATDARSLNAAILEANDCLEEAVAGRMKRGEPIPRPSSPNEGTVTITLSALYAMKAALYMALREARLSEAALAAKLGKDEKEVQRLLDPKHASGISSIEAALRAIGKRLQIVVENAE